MESGNRRFLFGILPKRQIEVVNFFWLYPESGEKRAPWGKSDQNFFSVVNLRTFFCLVVLIDWNKWWRKCLGKSLLFSREFLPLGECWGKCWRCDVALQTVASIDVKGTTLNLESYVVIKIFLISSFNQTLTTAFFVLFQTLKWSWQILCASVLGSSRNSPTRWGHFYWK